ncbi:hypothetical protein ACO0LG_08635 [Undibacterium sp. Ji42W]|uniref:hypothetical protein n=1 Tax=Undibacterium sp. Ji42W TaxID=3413039 RepID=UPI003BF11EA1
MEQIKLMETSSHKALIDTVVKAKGKFTKAVQVAATQAVGHFLRHGDTGFATRLLSTFSDNTLGAKTFVAFMEQHGGMKYEAKSRKNPAKFTKHETRDDLPAADNFDGIVSYMQEIYSVDWTTVKPEQVVSMFDVETGVKQLLAKLEREAKLNHEVKNIGLAKHLKDALAAYHMENPATDLVA